MSRTLTPAVDAALQQPNIREAPLAHFEFDSGHVRFWGGIGPLVWNAATFTGAGHLGEVSMIEESTEIKATGAVFRLSGVNSALVAIALAEHYQGRFCHLWRAFFDDDWQLIADPVKVFGGRLDTMRIVDDGERATIEVTAESRLRDLDRIDNVRYYTDQDQQARFPGDRFFEFVPQMQDAVIVWGRRRFMGTPAVDKFGKAISPGGTPEPTQPTIVYGPKGNPLPPTPPPAPAAPPNPKLG